MLRLMQQRYGCRTWKTLARAVMNDNAYYEDEASGTAWMWRPSSSWK